MTKREQVILEARSWLRTPYHHMGDLKEVGVDCAMLLVCVYKAVGLVPQDLDPRPYSPEWHLHRGEEIFLGWLEACGDRVERDQVRAGDVAVWRYGRTYSHGAIVLDVDGTIAHAVMAAGCVVLGNLRETELAARPAQFWRVRGIEEGAA